MKKWKIPAVYKVESASQFFAEMTELNKASKSFSQRELAKFLKWPASYIPDVIKNRKPFTAARALEFIRAFKLNTIDAEQIIFMAVSSQLKVDIPEVKNLRKIKSPQKQEGYSEIVVYSFKAVFILEIISLLRGQATNKKITSLMTAKGLNVDDVSSLLDLLIEKELVEKKGSFYRVRIEKVFSNFTPDSKQEAIQLQKDFIDNLKSFTSNIIQPAFGGSTFIQIRRSRYQEVREKILSLRNWIHAMSDIDSKTESLEDVLLFQLDLHLTPQFEQETVQKISAGK